MSGRPSWLPQDRPNIPMSLMVDAFARRDDQVDHILGPGGPIAQAMPNYRDRHQQRDMAQSVLRCLEQRRHMVCEAGTGTGKCIHGDTLITLEDGSRECIRDLVGGAHRIMRIGLNLKNETGETAEVFPSGHKPVVRVKTHSGREIVATKDHPLFTMDGWKRIEDIQVGECVAMARINRVKPTQRMPEHEVAYLALMIADGSCAAESPQYTKADPAMIAEYAHAVGQFENCRPTSLASPIQHGARRLWGRNPNGATLCLQKHGLLGTRSHGKFIPESIFTLELDQLALFIGRLWSGDGCIEGRGQVVSYCSVSKTMVLQVQHLLTRFGILSRMRRHDGILKGVRHEAYTLTISGSEMVGKFRDHIGPYLLGIKKDRMDAVEMLTPNPNADLIPSEAWRLVGSSANFSSWHKIRATAGVSSDRTRGISRPKMAIIAEYLQDDSLAALATSDVYWDPIASVTDEGEADTYDITMVGTPNFLANDFVVHNSAGLLTAAFVYALSKQKKIIVATGTLILQDQYRRDLAFLDTALGPYFEAKFGRKQRWAISKGRSNFHCIEEEGEIHGYQDELELIRNWDTETGDLTELPFDLTQDRYRPLRQFLTADAEDCPGRQKCPSGEVCHYYRARDKAEEADVIVVNHMILALDLLLDGQLLPEHDAVLIDEAHKLPDWVRNATEARLSRSRLKHLRGKADKLNIKTDQLAQVGEVFFDRAESLVVSRLEKAEDEEPSIRLQGQDFVGGSLDALLAELTRIEDDLAKRGDVPKAESLAKGFRQFRLDLANLQREAPGKILWAKQEHGRDGVLLAPSMRLTMVRVAPFLRETLLKRTCVFASATLATGPQDFSFFCEEVGLEGCHKMQVASPFDYRRNLQYFLPIWDDPNLLERKRIAGKLETSREQTIRICNAYEPVYRQWLTLTNGNALLLFTSKSMMLEMARRLYGGRWPLKRQGDEPKTALIRWLKEAPGRVVCGLDSFWEGVDVPGPHLSLVVVDRFPFTPPSDVVQNAIKEAYGMAVCGPDGGTDRVGRAGFKAYTLPMAVLKVKQACGRINRAEEDRGVFVFMDGRIRTKQYGAEAFASLPGAPVLGRDNLAASSLAMVPAWLAKARKS